MIHHDLIGVPTLVFIEEGKFVVGHDQISGEGENARADSVLLALRFHRVGSDICGDLSIQTYFNSAREDFTQVAHPAMLTLSDGQTT